MEPQTSSLVSRTACRHLFPSGRHCRFPVWPNAQFCIRHIRPHAEADAERRDLTTHFGPDPLNFKSGIEVNDFLCSLARLVIEDRITTRRAAVLAYIASLELRTLPVIELELAPSDDGFQRIVFDPPDGIDQEPTQHLPQTDLSPSVTTGR